MTVIELRRYLPDRGSSLFHHGEISMKKMKLLAFSALVLGFACLASSDGFGQPDPKKDFDKKDFDKKGPGGKGGFGPPGGQTRKILKDFDKDKNGWLNSEERKPAREVAKSGGRKGGFGFGRGKQEPQQYLIILFVIYKQKNASARLPAAHRFHQGQGFMTPTDVQHDHVRVAVIQ